MPEERKKKVRVVVGGESSCHVDGSGAAPDVGVLFIDQFPPDLPLCMKLLFINRRGGAEADDELEIISVGGPLSTLGGCESEGITFEETVGRVGLFSETETALDGAGLPIC